MIFVLQIPVHFYQRVCCNGARAFLEVYENNTFAGSGVRTTKNFAMVSLPRIAKFKTFSR
jgi:hypothetical protein